MWKLPRDDRTDDEQFDQCDAGANRAMTGQAMNSFPNAMQESP